MTDNFYSQTDYVGREGDSDQLEARIIHTLVGRWFNEHPGQPLIITRDEFVSFAEREIADNLGISMVQDADSNIVVSYKDRDVATRELRQQETDDITTIRAQCEAIMADMRAPANVREAARHTIATLDALAPQRGSDEATGTPVQA